MHPSYLKAHELSGRVIAAAIEVHRRLGPGLLESVYERCFLHELALNQIKASAQVPVKFEYKGLQFNEGFRLDVLVENCLVVELKAVDSVLPVHKTQILSYMKLADVPVGLLLIFP